MTVRREGETIHLQGDCPVEDADALLQHLLDPVTQRIDWTGATRLHTAVVQLVLAADCPVEGPCGDPFVAGWIEPGLVAARAAKA